MNRAGRDRRGSARHDEGELISSSAWRLGAALVCYALFALGVALLASLLVGEQAFGAALVAAGLYLLYVTLLVTPDEIAFQLGARPVHRETLPGVHELLELAARRCGLDESPELRVVHDPTPCAFTVADGERGIAVVSSGLLTTLRRNELEATLTLLALTVKSGDASVRETATSLIDNSLRRSFELLGRWLCLTPVFGLVFRIVLQMLLVVLAPAPGVLVRAVSSPCRVLKLDHAAAALHEPAALASAIGLIGAPGVSPRLAGLASAHLYMTDPLLGRFDILGPAKRLFVVHPAMAERIEALERAYDFKLEFAERTRPSWPQALGKDELPALTFMFGHPGDPPAESPPVSLSAELRVAAAHAGAVQPPESPLLEADTGGRRDGPVPAPASASTPAESAAVSDSESLLSRYRLHLAQQGRKLISGPPALRPRAAVPALRWRRAAPDAGDRQDEAAVAVADPPRVDPSDGTSLGTVSAVIEAPSSTPTTVSSIPGPPEIPAPPTLPPPPVIPPPAEPDAT